MLLEKAHAVIDMPGLPHTEFGKRKYITEH